MNEHIASGAEPNAAGTTRELAPAASGLEAGVQVGDFRIERRLGAGGMGIVYQARQISLNRPVALKVLGQALTRSADVSRFQREAQAAARLKHPAIAQVYFIGQDKHLCFMAMELIDGVSLRRALDKLETTAVSAASLDSVVRADLCDEPAAEAVRFDSPTEALPANPATGGTLPPAAAAEVNPYLSPQARELRTAPAYLRRVCELVRDAAQALAHAHHQGVVHRDIKPDNLLLDREGKVHLIDFGVARFFDDQAVTYTGQLVGTPLYMSPEQVTGRGTIDARSDVYSLGLVLCELLTLRPPIQATNRENLLRQIVTKPLPPVSWRNGAIPADLERIVQRATQKDPDQRFASAADLAADLDRFLAGQAVTAPPYHFRLDEREIVAARPGRVLLTAFLLIVPACCFSALMVVFALIGLVLLTTSAESGITGADMKSILVLGAIATASLVIAIFVGRGLLGARRLARWLAAGIAVVCMLVAVIGLFQVIDALPRITTLTSLEQLPSEKLDSVPEEMRQSISGVKSYLSVVAAAGAGTALLGGALGIAILWGVLSGPTSRWFRFARETRQEHRLLRQQMAQ